MGCSGSKPAVDEGSSLTMALEKKLISAVIGTKRRKSFKVKKSSFNNLMLQLPKLVAGFKKIRDAHQVATGGGKGTITWAAFCTSVGATMGLDGESDSLKEVLALPEVEASVPVTHPDLIIIFTVVYLLDGATKRRTIAAPEIRSCLELMEKSFMFFDSSADGCIERKELALALKSGTRVFGRKASKSLADRLFDQLDWSKDGQITFREYLVGMERIIIETGGDEEGDEDLGNGADGDDDDELENMGEYEGITPKGLAEDDNPLHMFKGAVPVAGPGPAPGVLPGGPVVDEVRPFTNTGMASV